MKGDEDIDTDEETMKATTKQSFNELERAALKYDMANLSTSLATGGEAKRRLNNN